MSKGKTTVVCIKNEKIHVLTNPKEADYIHCAVYLKNPELGKVRGLPPHEWKIENGEVLPIDPNFKAHAWDPEPIEEPALPESKVELSPLPSEAPLPVASKSKMPLLLCVGLVILSVIILAIKVLK